MCPFSASSRATTPISASSHGMPYSSRSEQGGAGTAKRDRSMPLGMMVNAAPPRPSAATLARIDLDGTINRSIAGDSAAKVATSSR